MLLFFNDYPFIFFLVEIIFIHFVFTIIIIFFFILLHMPLPPLTLDPS